ncbi:U3 small nucleolar RNA-associated protein 24 [Enteropsectra breve]|nr:U3 small nucleolar RNA-associated protein 24 [Enteropsectra breve]
MGKKAKIKSIKKMAYKKKKAEDEKTEMDKDAFEVTEDEREKSSASRALKPPYQVILDTNFINDCIRKKINAEDALRECLNADVQLYITECVFAELEKLGRVHRLALNMIKSMDTNNLKCLHKGTYADNCILSRAQEFQCYIVATSDLQLRQRIKKYTTTPIVYFRGHKLATERFAGLL